MNTTASDNDKLNTVVPETTEISCEERLKMCSSLHTLTQLSDYFSHILHIVVIIVTAKVLARPTK